MPLRSIEMIKQESRHLRGRLYDDVFLNRDSGVSEESRQLLKFFGMYQQQDRDLKKKSGAGTPHTFMIRVATAAGVLSSEQYLALDGLCRDLAQAQLRLTSRQAVQIHGVVKGHLAPLVTRLIEMDMSSLAGCGDVVRNLAACPLPDHGGARDTVRAMALELSQRLKPATQAYLELFVAGEKMFDIVEEESLYGEQYLPRKFKIGMTIAGDNCVDIYSHDVGLVYHPSTDKWTILVGGGLAQSHGVAKTHALLAQPLGQIPMHMLTQTVETIVRIQRDFGNRDDRRFARMKYLVEAWGLERFRMTVEERMGMLLDDPGKLQWNHTTDHLVNEDPSVLGVRLPHGRIRDSHGMLWASALRDVVASCRPTLHITAQQNLLLTGLNPESKAEAIRILTAYGVKSPTELSPFHRYALACPALPTCTLALAESERVVDRVVDQIERWWTEAGLSPMDLRIRMTGCPNNCARPFLAEVGLVGAAPGRYHVYVGGSPQGTRLARLAAERIPIEDLGTTLLPLFRQYRESRLNNDELFGDWCARNGIGQAPRASQNHEGG